MLPLLLYGNRALYRAPLTVYGTPFFGKHLPSRDCLTCIRERDGDTDAVSCVDPWIRTFLGMNGRNQDMIKMWKISNICFRSHGQIQWKVIQ